MSVVACIPAHNEEHSIAKVLLRTRKHVDHIITCNDGSTDETKEIAEHFSDHVVNHTTKQGYGRSLIDLFREALLLPSKVIVTLDADGQHNPDEIPKLTQPILEDKADIVLGSRFSSSRIEAKRYRQFGIRTINRLTQKASGHNFNDSQCGFRAYSYSAIQTLHLTEYGMGFSTETLLKATELGLRIVEVPISVYYHNLNSSDQNPVSHATDVVASIIRHVVERQPVKYLGVPAFLSLVISVFFAARTLELYVSMGMLIIGWAIISLFSFLFSTFLMNLTVTLYVLSRIRQGIEASK